MEQKYLNLEERFDELNKLYNLIKKENKILKEKYEDLNNSIIDSRKCYIDKCNDEECDFIYHVNDCILPYGYIICDNYRKTFCTEHYIYNDGENEVYLCNECF